MPWYLLTLLCAWKRLKWLKAALQIIQFRAYARSEPAWVGACYCLNNASFKQTAPLTPAFCWSMALSLAQDRNRPPVHTWPHLTLRPKCPGAHRWAQVHLCCSHNIGIRLCPSETNNDTCTVLEAAEDIDQIHMVAIFLWHYTQGGKIKCCTTSIYRNSCKRLAKLRSCCHFIASWLISKHDR